MVASGRGQNSLQRGNRFLTSCILLLVFLFNTEPLTSSEGMWALRSGRVTEQIPNVNGASLYFGANIGSSNLMSLQELLGAISGGDRSIVVPLAAHLLSEGKLEMATLYWEMDGCDLPATRNDLLDALAWFGRYELYPVMSLNPPVPADKEGSIHSDQCGAICTLGWMKPRADGLFHGDELVSAEDIQLLAEFFTTVDPSLTRLPASTLEELFRGLR